MLRRRREPCKACGALTDRMLQRGPLAEDYAPVCRDCVPP